MGKLVIITAPSGSGKSTIVNHLLDTIPSLSFSVSATTRPRRPHEIEAKDYYYIDVKKFKQYIHQRRFVEWEEVYPGQFYGTLKSELQRSSSFIRRYFNTLRWVLNKVMQMPVIISRKNRRNSIPES